MDNMDEILKGPERFDDKGIAVRLAYNEISENYRVEYSQLVEGEIEDEWYLFGGSVGYEDSVYQSESEAQEVYEEIRGLPGEEILDEFAVDSTHRTTEGGENGE